MVALAGADREQGRILLNYTSAPFETSEDLRGLVQSCKSLPDQVLSPLNLVPPGESNTRPRV